MKLKICGLTFALLSYIPLLFPVYKVRTAGETGYDLIIRGFNLAEFSVWGGLLMIIPIILFALAYCGIGNRHKSIALMGICIFGVITVCYAGVPAKEWVKNAAEGYVRYRPYHIIGFVCMLASMACTFADCNRSTDK